MRRAVQVRDAWASQGGAADGDIVVRAFNDMVSKGSLRTLRSGEWLGDEVRELLIRHEEGMTVMVVMVWQRR